MYLMVLWQLSYSLMNNNNATLLLRVPVLIKPGTNKVEAFV